MKTTKKVFSMLLALAIVFALCACSFELGGTETWENTSEERDGAKQLYNDFFAKTFENTNLTVTTKTANDSSVEIVDGTSDHATFTGSGAETYAFIKDGEYIYAMSDSEYFMTGEERYGYAYKMYKKSLDVFALLDEDPASGATFSCTVKGEKKDGVSSTDLTLVVKNGEYSITINANAKDDLVQSVTVVRVDEDGSTTSTMNFQYGGASITLPDITGWTKGEQ